MECHFKIHLCCKLKAKMHYFCTRFYRNENKNRMSHRKKGNHTDDDSAGRRTNNILLGITSGLVVIAAIVFGIWYCHPGSDSDKAFAFQGEYPPVTQVVFNQDGEEFCVEAVQGQVLVYFADGVTHSDAIRAIRKAKGNVVAQIPDVHYYLVSVEVGREAAFMQDVQQFARVRFVFPNAVSYPTGVTSFVLDDYTFRDGDGATHGEEVSYTLQECGGVSSVKKFDVNAGGDRINWSEVVHDLHSILSNNNYTSLVINMSFGVRLRNIGQSKYWSDAEENARRNYRNNYIREIICLLELIEPYQNKDFVIVKSSGNDGVKNFDRDIVTPLYNTLSQRQRAVMDKHVILVAAEDTRWSAYSNELEMGRNHPWVTKVDISDLQYRGRDIHGTSFSAPRASCFISSVSMVYDMKATRVLQLARDVTRREGILTKESLMRAAEGDTTIVMRDYDGNVYPTVKIGRQVWMAENIRATHDRDGNEIPLGNWTREADIYYPDAGLNYPNYTDPRLAYPDYSYSNVRKYGCLYNWPAAKRVCPRGWHLPTDAEWTELENYVGSQRQLVGGGGKKNIAKALASEEDWEYCSEPYTIGNGVDENNATGFSVSPAGYYDSGNQYREDNLFFNDLDRSGVLWSSTVKNNSDNYYFVSIYCRFFYTSYSTVMRETFSMADCCSVRCVKD